MQIALVTVGLVFVLTAQAAGPAWRRLTATNSWFANSYADARFMPQGVEGMYVTPDGTTYTNIRWEEGGGKVGDQPISRGHIDLYDGKTGATVGYLEPPPNWGTGWMDAVECLSVYQRRNGEHLIIQEEDGRSKNLLHRWHPSTSLRLP